MDITISYSFIELLKSPLLTLLWRACHHLLDCFPSGTGAADPPSTQSESALVLQCLLTGQGLQPQPAWGLPWPHSGLSRSFLGWRFQNWTLIHLQGLPLPRGRLCICPCWLWHDSCWSIPPGWTLFVGPLPSRASISYLGLVSPTHSVGEHSIISCRWLTIILPLQLKHQNSDQCLQFLEGSNSWKTDFQQRFHLPSHGKLTLAS